MGRGLVFAVAVVCALAGAESAQAGTLAKVGSEYQYTEPAGSATSDQVNLYYCAGSGCSAAFGDPGNYFIIGGASAPNPGSSGCFTWPYSSAYMQCPVEGISGWRIAMGDGNDVVNVPVCCGEMTVPVAIFGEGGNDSLNVSAGSQADVLDGGPGADSLFSGAGNDVLDGGFGSDTLNAGDGAGDIVTFAGRSEGVTVDLGNAGADDGSANDGAPGARDTIQNVEHVIGGSAGDDIDGSTVGTALTIEGGGGGDRIRGGLGPNTLRGEGGNDNLEGRGGSDFLDGGDGHDTLDALGGADILRGGLGFDSIYALDGVADDVDCGADDDVATTDSVDTRVNCDPAPAPASGSGGGESTTTNTITTVTVFGPVRILFDLGYVFSATRRATTLREFSLEVEPGARVKATCRTPKGKRCERTRDVTKAAASATLRLRGFERKPLPVGSKLRIRATKPDMVGAVKTVTIRKRKAPSVKTLCLPPGATRPAAC
jgi:Ca2+-binding RTX toxin-like protein